ncbi:MAG: formyltransferase family protein [Gemmatimonadota bacterium]
MRAIFLGKDKPAAIAGLEHLGRVGIEVTAVVAPDPAGPLAAAARTLGVPVVEDADLYAALRGEGGPAATAVRDIDLVLSFLFWRRIRAPLITLPTIGCVNFHPAPLPDLRGLGGYNVAILDDLPAYGVSAHFVAEAIDAGDLIAVRRFPIDAATATAFSLEQASQAHLLELFQDVVAMAHERGALPRAPQGEGRYIGREAFEGLRRIQPGDSPETIERRIRAFWYPPYPGAQIEVGGRLFTLVNDAVLREAGRHYHPGAP